MVYTHDNFGTSYINPMAYESLNEKFKNSDMISLPRIKKKSSYSKSNYGSTFKSFNKKKRNGGSVKRVNKRNSQDNIRRGELFYPYSLFEKIMNVGEKEGNRKR